MLHTLSQIVIGEISMYTMKSTREALLAQEKTIITGDCCYLNPLIRRMIRFIGENFMFVCVFSFVTFKPLLRGRKKKTPNRTNGGKRNVTFLYGSAVLMPSRTTRLRDA